MAERAPRKRDPHPARGWGGGSGTQGASVPIAGGIVLDLRSMNRILEIDERLLTATVEAGLNGREFEQLLNERGLMFPHYPASAEWATVGGYIAARGSGVLSTRYGKIEDLSDVALGGDPNRRADPHRPGSAPRRRAGADPALRRVGGNPRRHHAAHGAACAAAGAAPLRGRAVP